MARPSQDDATSENILVQLLAAGGIADAVAVSHALLIEFGTLRRVVSANPSRLRRIASGATCDLIHLYRTAVVHALKPAPKRIMMNSASALQPYLLFDVADRGLEQFRVFFLDLRLGLICEDIVAYGTIDECRPYIRAILSRALDVGAAGLICVHNHPSGEAEPSKEDIDFTRRLAQAGSALNIRVYDHLIVGSAGCYSMRREGLM